MPETLRAVPRSRRDRVLIVLAAVCALPVVPASPGEASAARSCGRIVDPYPNSRYEGVDIRRIRATRVTCRRARRVARRAHGKALRITPPVSGIRRFAWRGWQVTGDLRGSSDRYLAKRGRMRVRWLF